MSDSENGCCGFIILAIAMWAFVFTALLTIHLWHVVFA